MALIVPQPARPFGLHSQASLAKMMGAEFDAHGGTMTEPTNASLRDWIGKTETRSDTIGA
jgi:hypothetical protein